MVSFYFVLCGVITGMLLGYLGVFFKENAIKYLIIFSIIHGMLFYWKKISIKEVLHEREC